MKRARGEAGTVSAGRRRRDAVVAVIVGAVVAVGGWFVLDAILAGGQGGRATGPAQRATDAETSGTGRSLFARMGCGNCHAFRAGNSAGNGAPDLDVVLAGHTRRSLKAKIVDPYPDRAADFFPIMPEDFGRRMSDAELDALVTFLLESR